MRNDEPEDGLWGRFIARVSGDIAAGRLRSVAAYQAEFPGLDDRIADDYGRRLAAIGAFARLGTTDASTAGMDATAGQPSAATPAPSEDADSQAELTHFGRYRITRELGRGGQGTVYLAREDFPQRAVALKLLPANGPSAGRDYRRFRREADSTALVQDAGICQVYDCGLREGHMFIAMQYVPGSTLAESLRLARERHAARTAETQTKPEPPRTSECESPSWSGLPDARDVAAIARTFERLALSLHKAHEARLIHRDIKPANIIVSTEGTPVLLDFGLARSVDGDHTALTQEGVAPGTLSYMSPEQLSGQPETLDRRTDVWSLGVTLFECLTLARPFDAATADGTAGAIRAAVFRQPRAINAAIPRDLATVVTVALDRDVRRRYATAAAVAEDLRRIREHLPIRARPAGVALRAWRWAQRKPAVATLLAAVASATIVLGAWTFWPATLYIESTPSGAAISVDGKPTGRVTPGLVGATPSGTHAIDVALAGYEVRHVPKTSVRGDDPRRGDPIELTPASGKLTVTSPLQDVTMNLAPVGGGAAQHFALPFSKFVNVGHYRITASRPNYFPAETDVEVTSNRESQRNIPLESMELQAFRLPGWSLNNLFVGDLDGDAEPDFVITGARHAQGPQMTGESAPPTSVIAALRGRDAAVLWTHGLGEATAVSISAAALFDVDGDGTPDLVAHVHRDLLRDELLVLSGRAGQVLLRHDLPRSEHWACTFTSTGPSGLPCALLASADGMRRCVCLRDGVVVWHHGAAPAAKPDWVQTLRLDEAAPARAGLLLIGRNSGSVEWVRPSDGTVARTLMLGATPESVCFDDFGHGREAIISTRAPSRVVRVGIDAVETVWEAAAGRIAAVFALHEDLDNDGLPDIAIADSTRALTLLSVAGRRTLGIHRLDLEPLNRQHCALVGRFAPTGSGILIGAANQGYGDRAGTSGAAIWVDPRSGRQVVLPVGDEVPEAIVPVDWSGSGIDDFAVASTSLSVGTPSTTLRVMTAHRRGVGWDSRLGEAIWSSPAVGVLTRDGLQRAVVGCNDGAVYCVSLADGAIVWRHVAGEAEHQPVWSSPVLGDLDGDGLPDVVVGSDNGRIYALSGIDGHELWPPVRTGAEVSSTPCLADVDGDGTPDVVVGSFDGFIYVVSGRTGQLVCPPLGPERATPVKVPFYAQPEVRDVLGDGTQCVVAASWDGNVYAFSLATRAVVRTWRVGGTLRSRPLWVDINGDGKADLVAFSGERGGPRARIVAFSGAATESRPMPMREAIIDGDFTNSSPAASDVNNDGIPDIIVGGGGDRDGGRVSAFSGADFSPLWQWSNPDRTWASPTLACIRHPSRPDVVISSEDGALYVLAGDTGAVLHRFQTQAAVRSTAAIARTGDRTLALVGSYDHRLYAIDVSPDVVAMRARVPPERRLRAALRAGSWRTVIDNLEATPDASPAARALAAEAQIALKDWGAAAADTAAAMREAPMLQRLPAMHLLASLAARRAVDTPLLAAAIAHDPIDFVATLLGYRSVWDALPEGALQRALEGILQELLQPPHDNPLAAQAVRLLLGQHSAPTEPLPDMVSRDFQVTLEQVGRLLDGPANLTDLDRMGSEPGRRFAELWPRDPAALRKRLALPPLK